VDKLIESNKNKSNHTVK